MYPLSTLRNYQSFAIFASSILFFSLLEYFEINFKHQSCHSPLKLLYASFKE